MPKEEVDPGERLRDELTAAVVAGMGRFSRPREIPFVPDLPKTPSMTVMRRVIRAVLFDDPAGDLSALVNPESMGVLRAITVALRRR